MCRTTFDFFGERDFSPKFQAFGQPNAWTWLCLDLNEKCNCNCTYCFTNSSPNTRDQRLSFAQIRSLVDQAADIGLVQVSLLGGEPMLRGDLLKISRYIASRKTIVHLCSNGSLIDRRMAQALLDSGITQVQINLDHVLPEAHDRIRGLTGSFSIARSAIDSLLEVGMSVVVATVILPDNFEVIPSILHLAHKLGVNSYRVWDFIPSGRGKRRSRSTITAVQYRELLLKLLDIAGELELPLIRSGEPLLATMPDISARLSYTPCPAGTLMYSVSARGDVHICSMDRDNVVGNIRFQPLRQILESETFADTVADRFKAVGCIDCRFLATCQHGCKLRIEDRLGKDSKCWL